MTDSFFPVSSSLVLLALAIVLVLLDYNFSSVVPMQPLLLQMALFLRHSILPMPF